MAPTRYLHSNGTQFILGPNGDDMIRITPAYSDLLGLDGSRLVGPNAEVDAKLIELREGDSPRDVAGRVSAQVQSVTREAAASVITEVITHTSTSTNRVIDRLTAEGNETETALSGAVVQLLDAIRQSGGGAGGPVGEVTLVADGELLIRVVNPS